MSRNILNTLIFLCLLIAACDRKEDVVPGEPIPTVSTLAGGDEGFLDGTGSTAKFNKPVGITLTPDGNLYVADQGNRAIRKVTPEGVVTTVAKNLPSIGSITCLAVTQNGTIYFSTDYGIYRLNPDNSVTTLALGSDNSYPFHNVRGMIAHTDGNLYLTHWSNARVTMMSPDGQVTRFAGGLYDSNLGTNSGDRDGDLNYALFDRPSDLCFGSDGAMYVTDVGSNKIRKIFNGQVITIAGSIANYGDGIGKDAAFWWPMGIAATPDGILYIVDNSNGRIRKMSTATGKVTTLAGGAWGSQNYLDGIGESARFNGLTDILTTADGSLLISDTNNNRIRKITFQK